MSATVEASQLEGLTCSGDEKSACLPLDWKLVPFDELFEFKNGVNADKKAYGTGVPFANVLEVITNAHLRGADIPGRVAIPTRVIEAYRLLRGDVLFNRTSETQDEVGLTSVYLDKDTSVFGGFVIRGRPKGDQLDPVYAGYGLRSRFIRKQMIAMGQGAIHANIGQADLKKVVTPIPPMDEQRAIAAALSDVDTLIGALDVLIAKNRAIKLATMQQLLTGKTRLRQYVTQTFRDVKGVGAIPTDWTVNELRNIAVMHGRIGWQGLKESEFTSNPDDPFLITGMNFKDGEIAWAEVYHVPLGRYEVAPQIQLRPGDVLMTKDGTIGKLLFVREIPHPGLATLNSHLLAFRPKNQCFDPLFLYYQMSSRRFLDHIELYKSGSTFFGLTQAATGKFLTILPPLNEQRAIAEALSDMDLSIASVERRRDKTQAIKRGMMQQLLTGRTRLV